MSATFSPIIQGARPQIVFIGDSLFNVPTAPGNIPGVLAAALTGYDVINLSVNGQKSAETLAAFLADGGAADYYSSARSKNILVINVGANDVQSVGTGSTFTNIDTIVTTATTAGWFVIATCSPAIGDALFSGPNDTALAAVAAQVRAAYDDAHTFDLRADSHFDTQADADNTTYYNADETHLAAGGVTLAVSILQPLVEAVPAAAVEVTQLGSLAGQDSDDVSITGGTFAGSTVTASGAIIGATVAANSMRAKAVAFAAYPTEGFRFTNAANAISGGMVEITNSGIEYLIFYSSSAGSIFSWRTVYGDQIMTLDATALLTVEKVAVGKTVTAGGTTGAQTINRQEGTVNFAGSATSLVVTNSLCTTNTPVLATIQTNDFAAVLKGVVPANGSFTIRMSTAPTAETAVAFHVML